MAGTTTSLVHDATPGLDIVAACPKCGGSNAWRLLQTLLRCAYCDSALWWPRDPKRPGFLIAEDTVASPAALLDVLQTLDAMRERARIAGIAAELDRGRQVYIDRSDDPMLPSLNEIKDERRKLFALEEHHKVLAPYVLLSTTLAFHALGRSRGGDLKEFRNLFFLCEEIAPAYETPWNFRDRGLWVAKQRLRPFTPDDLAEHPIPRQKAAVDMDRLTERWRGQRMLIQPDIDPISFDSDLLEPARWWVFRPFHYVKARTPMQSGWFLIDAQFGNVAGYPDDAEVSRATAAGFKPLDSEEIRGATPRVVGFRCPECGADVPLVERTETQLCENCGRLLVPAPEGLKTRPYAIVDPAAIPWWPKSGDHDVAWLPFFRVEASLARAGKKLGDFATLLRETVPVTGRLKSLMPEVWPESWIPAFDVMTVNRYEAWAVEWSQALTRTRPERQERRFFLDEPVAKANRVLPVALQWETIRPLLSRLLLGMLAKPIQSRLNPMILSKILTRTLAVTHVELVFVPAPITTDGERRVLGPTSAVGWLPLRDGNFPPDLQRDVRRALDRGKRLDAEREDGGLFTIKFERHG